MFQKIHLFKVSYLLEKKLVITLAKQVDAVISDAHATFQEHKRRKSNNDREFFSATWSFQIFKKPNLNRVKINVTIYFSHTLDDEEIHTNGYSVVSIPSCKCYCFLQFKNIYIFFQFWKFLEPCVSSFKVNMKDTVCRNLTLIFLGRMGSKRPRWCFLFLFSKPSKFHEISDFS